MAHHNIHHTSIQVNSQSQTRKLSQLKTQVLIISKMIKNNATAVASFIRDSHSKIYVSLFGTQTSLNIAITATGSVAEIIAQNKNVKLIGISIQNKNNNQYLSQNAISVVDIISQKTASDIIGIASLTIFL